MSQEEKKILNKDQLEAASGGASQNRYDPNRCNGATRSMYECVGLLGAVNCDHFQSIATGRGTKASIGHPSMEIYRHKCAMGCFNYEGTRDGSPI